MAEIEMQKPGKDNVSDEERLRNQKMGLEFPCVPAGSLWSKPLESKVVMDEGRQWRDPFTGATFLCILVAQLALSAALLGSADPQMCGTFGGNVVGALTDGFGKMMELYVGGFAGLMVAVFVIGALWLSGLMFFAQVVTWGTLALDIIALCALGVYIGSETSATEMTVTMIAVAVLFTGYLYYIRADVKDAAVLMQNAAFALKANVSLLVVLTMIMLVMFAYLALVLAGMISSFMVFDCESGDDNGIIITYPRSSWASNSMSFLSATMAWTFFTMNMFRSYICSATTAMWTWNGAQPTMKPFTAAKWAMTKSFGSMSIAGLLVTIIDYITSRAKSVSTNCTCCCNPLWWLLRVAICVLEDYFNALCRFSLSFAAISGEGFWVSAQRALFNLKGKFAKLFKVNSTASLVLHSGALIFALCVSLMAFGIGMGESGGENDTEDGIIAGYIFGDGPSFLIIPIWMLGCYLMYYPLAAIVVVAFLSGILAPIFGYAFLFAIFVGALANYMLTFFAGSILDVTTALFVIGVIQEKNGGQVQEGAEGSPEYVLVHMQRRLQKISEETNTNNPPAANPAVAQPAVAVAQPVAVAVPVASP